MKTRTIIIALIALLALNAACTNEEQAPGDGQVHFTATIASQTPPLQGGGARSRAEGASTRAPQLGTDGSGTFQTTDTWGLYAHNADVQKLDNMAYKLDGTTPVLWADLSTTDPVTFAAHYPRQTTGVNDPEVYRFVLMGDAGDDLLLATDTKSPGQRVDLTFRHLMHRLTINLLAGPGVTDTELDDAYITTVKAPGGGGIMPESVTVNLLTGQVTPYAASQKITYRGGRNVDWIVVPQTLTPGADWLKITRDNDVWHFPVPDLDLSLEGNQTELKSGKHLTLTLTLKKTPAGGNQVELTSTGIGAWANQAVIKDDVDLGGGTAITTPAQLRAALEGAGTDPIVINGDLTLSLDANLTLGADHTLSIATGATLTIANGYSIDGGHTLTLGGGGTVLFDESNQNYIVIDGGTLHLQNVTVEMRGGIIAGCAIEVGTDATIVVNSRFKTPLQLRTKNLTVRGNIRIEDFLNSAISCEGTLSIDGGTISIDGLGTIDTGTPTAVWLDGGTGRLEIANGGRLTSTVPGGVVYLTLNSKVAGAGGLFRTDSYTLATDNEVIVGFADTTTGLKTGVYKWNVGESKFVWASAN